MEKPCQGLTYAEIVAANRRLTEAFGGNHGLLNPGSLEHMLEQLQGSLFGEPLHPTVTARAAFLCVRLAQGHFFLDGNKRTALWCCKAFLALNGLSLTLEYAEVEAHMIAIAQKKMDAAEVESWLIRRLSTR